MIQECNCHLPTLRGSRGSRRACDNDGAQWNASWIRKFRRKPCIHNQSMLPLLASGARDGDCRGHNGIRIQPAVVHFPEQVQGVFPLIALLASAHGGAELDHAQLQPAAPRLVQQYHGLLPVAGLLARAHERPKRESIWVQVRLAHVGEHGHRSGILATPRTRRYRSVVGGGLGDNPPRRQRKQEFARLCPLAILVASSQRRIERRFFKF
mmetsp:Transcript_161076/g.517027  ORF Transcript_161076/g.517027 Transcript_161076/m.517027 type:complete len:210 (-) Transcript_161076:717-1346(-)